MVWALFISYQPLWISTVPYVEEDMTLKWVFQQINDPKHTYYKNSVIIDFTVVPARPKLDRVRQFIFQQMGIAMCDIKTLQTRIIKAHVIIEVASAKLAEELAYAHNLKHTVDYEGELFQIPVYTADNIKEIRVFDLPCQMPNSVIVKNLSAYGEVIFIRNDVWKDMFAGITNGTRLVRMKLHKEIPSYVAMQGAMSFITYNGQTRTCKYCAFPLHIGQTCAQNKEKVLGGGLTAAEIMQLPGTSAPLPPKPTAPGTIPPFGSNPEGNNAQPGRPAPAGATNPTVPAIQSQEDNAKTDDPNAYESEEDDTSSIESLPEGLQLEMESAPTNFDTSSDAQPQLSNSTATNQQMELDSAPTDRDISPDISTQMTSDTTTECPNTRQTRARDGSSVSIRGKPPASGGKRPGSPEQDESKRRSRQQKH